MCVSLCLVPRDALHLFRSQTSLTIQKWIRCTSVQTNSLSLVLPEVVISLVAFLWTQGLFYLWSRKPSAWWTFSLRQMGLNSAFHQGASRWYQLLKKISFLVYKIETTCVICPLGKTWAKQSNSKVPVTIPLMHQCFYVSENSVLTKEKYLQGCLDSHSENTPVNVRVCWLTYCPLLSRHERGWLSGGPHPRGSSSHP